MAKPNYYWKLYIVIIIIIILEGPKTERVVVSQHLSKAYLTFLWQLWFLYLLWAWSNFKRTIKIDFCISSKFVLRALIFLIDGVSNWQLYYKKKKERKGEKKKKPAWCFYYLQIYSVYSEYSQTGPGIKHSCERVQNKRVQLEGFAK